MPERLINARTGQTALAAIDRANGPWKSFRGLMFRTSMPDDYGLYFAPAKGIHTQFMRFPIDLIFMDQEQRVTKIREAMPPWRFDFTNAAAVIETNAGVARKSGIAVGDQLVFDSNESD